MNRIATLNRGHGGRSIEGSNQLLSRGWLARMPADFQQALLSAAIWYEASAGSTFIHAGDDRGGIFGIAHGSAEIALLKGHPDTLSLHIVGSGFWAGYRPLLGRPRHLTLVARTPLLWALVPQSAMQRLLDEHPHWWQHLLQLAEDNVEIAAGAFADLTLQDSTHRAVAVLLRLAGCRSSGPAPGENLSLRVSQSELSGMAVMSRNTLNAVLKPLIEADLIEVAYRSISLKNPAALRALLDEA